MTKLLSDEELEARIGDLIGGFIYSETIDGIIDIINTQKQLAIENYARQILSDDEVLRFFESRNVNSALDEAIMTFISNNGRIK